MSDTRIHLKKKGFWRLLHNPEEIITFKDVMDNLKNYAIVGSLYFFARLAYLYQPSSGWLEFSAIVLIIVAAITGLMCFAQSWVLGQKAVYAIWPPQSFWTGPTPLKEQVKLILLMSIPALLLIVTLNLANAAVFLLAESCR